MNVVLQVVTHPAFACAVCTDPNDPRSDAYFRMTLFLSALPLTALGFLLWWMVRQYRADVPS